MAKSFRTRATALTRFCKQVPQDVADAVTRLYQIEAGEETFPSLALREEACRGLRLFIGQTFQKFRVDHGFTKKNCYEWAVQHFNTVTKIEAGQEVTDLMTRINELYRVLTLRLQRDKQVRDASARISADPGQRGREAAKQRRLRAEKARRNSGE